MLDELRNGGEARSFKTVLTLRREAVLTTTKSQKDETWIKNMALTHVSILDYKMSPLLIREHRQDVFARFAVTFPHQEVTLLPQ